MHYDEWLKTLTTKQLRALACQCGMVNWFSSDLNEIGVWLAGSTQAMTIFQETYGKETSIPNVS